MGRPATHADDGKAAPGWPRLLAVFLLCASLAVLIWLSLGRTGGRLVYALDDPYIHMAMARHVAVDGVWGVTAQGFTSSSSSLAWTALLAAAFGLVGIREAIPFLVNVVLATALVWGADRLLIAGGMRTGWARALTLAVFVFATPLPALVFAGQEHLLHIGATLAFVFLAADALCRHEASSTSRERALVALAMLLPLIRYEGLYPVAVVAAAFAFRRRPGLGLLLVGAAALPVAGYAGISMAKGWLWAPNSVLLKGNLPDWRTLDGLRALLGYTAYSGLLALPVVAFLLWAAFILLAIRLWREVWKPDVVVLGLFVALTLLHLQFSQPRAFWLFRYEAYVVALGILGVALSAWLAASGAAGRPEGHNIRIGIAITLLLVLVSPLPDRAARALAIVPQATANIHEQQYQMGRFLREHYAGEAVALNDIGAPAFLADVDLVDLVGLASIEIARLRRAGRYTTDTLADTVRDRGVRIAIVYDQWFPGRLPGEWQRAGAWRIRNPVVVGSHTVTFYATAPDELPWLRAKLRQFEASLPPGVQALYER